MSRNPRVIAADSDHPVQLPDAFCQASSQQGSPGPAENRLRANKEAVVSTADESCAGHEGPAATSSSERVATAGTEGLTPGPGLLDPRRACGWRHVFAAEAFPEAVGVLLLSETRTT